MSKSKPVDLDAIVDFIEMKLDNHLHPDDLDEDEKKFMFVWRGGADWNKKWLVEYTKQIECTTNGTTDAKAKDNSRTRKSSGDRSLIVKRNAGKY